MRIARPFLSTLAGTIMALTALQALARPLGIFADHADVGAPAIAGNAVYNAASQEYTLNASGINMWGKSDQFHFAYRKIQGDFILQARVAFLGTGEAHRKAGWTVRKTLDADSPYIDATIHGDTQSHGDGGARMQYRRNAGDVTEQSPMIGDGADIVQLERRGNVYTVSAAKFGEPYVVQQMTDIDLGDDVYVGLFLCSHNGATMTQAVFSNVRLIRTAKPDFVPYHDYIGSQLELLDVATGDRQIIYSSADPFEAPNWTHDGAALQFNSSGADPDKRGRLYRFDLVTRQPALIDTGFAHRLNNDHVLSFDGSMVGISDQTTDKNESTIFVLPSTGGIPKRITPNTPSYLHSWSPDGKYLLYTGGRKVKDVTHWDIYRAASDGSGTEVKLTNSMGLNDGPEYSPDGKYIYFNSTRSGKMQIYRMNADGSDTKQLTNDEYNNWFPHVSPDGKWLCIISYVDEITPTDHPYYKHVYLRLMPAEGGTPKVIAYVYGGQGTINVPSWSPDGKFVAFVSNTDMKW
jgi:TolB protein